MIRLDKIISHDFKIPYDQIVRELHQLLDFAEVTVSSWGTRLVSISGFEGTVELDKITYIYVRAKEFQKARASPSEKKASPSLEERMKCLELKYMHCNMFLIQLIK